MSNLLTLSSAQLKRAAGLKDRIAALEKQLSALLGDSSAAPKAAKPAKRKNKISAAGIARIKAAQKARWAKVKAAKKAKA
jgi:hypothetical protein